MNSKKIVILASILFLLYISNSSNAQNFKFGFKGGLNLSHIRGTKPYETKMKTGFNIYGFADFLNYNVMSISAEVGYTQKGFEYPRDVYDEKYIFIGRENANAMLDYIEFSVVVKLKIPGKIIVPYLLTGPSLGIKVRDEVSSTHPGTYGDLDILLINFSETTFGMKFGVGSELKVIPNIGIVLEARYNADLSISYNPPSLTTGAENWFNNSHDLRNHVFEFMAGVKF